MPQKEIKTSLLIPANIWKRAKIKAAREGISLGEFFRRAVKEYLGKKPEASPKGDKQKQETNVAWAEPYIGKNGRMVYPGQKDRKDFSSFAVPPPCTKKSHWEQEE